MNRKAASTVIGIVFFVLILISLFMPWINVKFKMLIVFSKDYGIIENLALTVMIIAFAFLLAISPLFGKLKKFVLGISAAGLIAAFVAYIVLLINKSYKMLGILDDLESILNSFGIQGIKNVIIDATSVSPSYGMILFIALVISATLIMAIMKEE